MSNILRIALIGYGRSGRDIHAKILSTLPDHYKIVASVELDPARRAMQKQELSCDVYDDYRALFARNDIDLVVNASFSNMHVPVTIDLLDHGFCVLCEKPMAHTAEQVDAMIEASHRAGKTLAIFQQSRYAPYFTKVQEVIASGVLGRIVQISLHFNGFARRWDWQCIKAMGGGNLYNTGPHPVDQALQLLSCDTMPSITCFMDRANTSGDAEDYVKLLLHAPNRPLIDLEISSCCAYPSFTYNVQGTNGGLVGGQTHLDWRYFDPTEAPAKPLHRQTLRGADDTPLYCGETLPWQTDSWDASDAEKDMFLYMGQKYYHMLYQTLAHGQPLAITPQQVRQQIAVMQECHRQAPLSTFITL